MNFHFWGCHLASSSCGSTYNLVIEGYNGFKFKFNDQYNFEKKLIHS